MTELPVETAEENGRMCKEAEGEKRNMQIRNLVFDMGNVLMEYEADRVCRHYIQDEQTMQNVCNAVFGSQEWVLLDMGLISEADALVRMQAHLRTPEEKEYAALCFRDWHLYNKWPKPGMEELLHEMKARGFGIYLLSNASMRVAEVCRMQIPGADVMSGMLFSAEIKYIKPQPEMYETLCNRFGLNPAECLFVDDLQMNIDGAERAGMRGYCFADGDIGRLRAALCALSDEAREA